MKLKSLSLPLAVVALASLGVALEVEAKSATLSQPDAAKVTESLTAQPKSDLVVTLTARDRGAHINLRSQPTARSRAVGYGLPGDRVDLWQCVQDYDTPGSDLNWCKVHFPVSGAVGWIRSDFIIFPSDGE
jgi:SH3-like domain-containing protein